MGIQSDRCPSCGSLKPLEADTCDTCGANPHAGAKAVNVLMAAAAAVLIYEAAMFMKPAPPPPAPPPVACKPVPPPPPVKKDTDPSEYTIDDVDEAIRWASANREKLGDGALVMPLLDADGKCSALGTTLAIMGTYQATFMPHRKLRGGVPGAIVQFARRGWFENVKGPGEAERRAVARALRAATIATGTLTREKDTYALALTVSAPRRTGTYSTRAPVNKPEALVAFIALSIHQTLGTPLSAAEFETIGKADGLDAGYVEKLAELKCGTSRKATSTTFEPMLAHPTVPDLALALGLWVADPGPVLEGLLDRAKAQAAGHPFVDMARASAASGAKKVLLSINLELQLLRTDWGEQELYALFDSDLWSANRQEEMDRLFRFWKGLDDGYQPLQMHGSFLVRWGWKDRADGKQPGCAQLRETAQQHFRAAEADLTAAYDKEKEDMRIPMGMLSAIIALGDDRATMEKWYAAGRTIEPTSLALALRKLTYLMPRWHGTEAEMFAFARSRMTEAATGSPAAQIIFDAHKEASDSAMAAGTAKTRRDYFRIPVYREILGTLAALDTAAPNRAEVDNRWAATAYWTQDFRGAAQQFARIGDSWDSQVWKDFDEFDTARRAAFAFAADEPRSRRNYRRGYSGYSGLSGYRDSYGGFGSTTSAPRGFMLLYMEF